jgi:hypothetical protein
MYVSYLKCLNVIQSVLYLFNNCGYPRHTLVDSMNIQTFIINILHLHPTKNLETYNDDDDDNNNSSNSDSVYNRKESFFHTSVLKIIKLVLLKIQHQPDL